MDPHGYDLKKCPACGAYLAPLSKEEQKEGYLLCKYCNSRIEIGPGPDRKPEESNGTRGKPGQLPGELLRLIKNHKFLITGASLGILFFYSIFLRGTKPEYSAGKQIIHAGTSDKIPAEVLKQASVMDKYSQLKQVVNCPADSKSYGSFYDYGYWGGRSWCGEKTEPGYWVWIEPNWFVWGKITVDESRLDPSVNGKYSGLLQVVKCEGDRENYGSFQDYGYWNGKKWCGQDVKPGYWVWVAPSWYVWENVKK